MKKTALSILLLMAVLGVRAVEFAVDGVNYKVTSSNTVSVLPYGSSGSSGGGITGLNNGYTGDVVIPETVTNNGVAYTVTAAEEETFSYSSKLTSVSLPATVTELGEVPFEACGKLAAITVHPDNPVYMSVDGVLFDKSGTKLIACPGAKEGEYQAPATVRTLAPSAFYGCSRLTSITLPESLTEIGTDAFRSCTVLKSVNIPEGITEISDRLFYGCGFLQSVSIPDGVVTIGASAFYNCKRMVLSALPSALKSIGEHAFERCAGILELTVPEGVQTIGNFALMGCSSMQKVSLPASLNHLGVGTFRLCLSLQTIELNPANTHFVIEDGVLFNADKTSLICCPATFKGEYAIPNTVTVIEDYAFYYCQDLSKVVLPDNLVAIRNGAFTNCASLESITIPESVTVIGENAFVSCTELKYILCKAGTPPSIAKELFSPDAYEDVVLYAPFKSKGDYASAEFWKKFQTFRGIGDVNQDGSLNVADIMMLVNYVIAQSHFEVDEIVADVNYNSEVNVTDVMGVVKMAMGL